MRVYSIFSSIQGEVNYLGQGVWATFVRFAGCNLSCPYCDTKYAWGVDSGKEVGVSQVVHEVDKLGVIEVTLTGGEPLLQEDLLPLLKQLKSNDHNITIETNGSLLPQNEEIFEYVDCWVVDYKIGMKFDNKWLDSMLAEDFLKFVITNFSDYKQARSIVKHVYEESKNCPPRIAFSPVTPGLNVNDLMTWMRKDKLYMVQINLQLHKLAHIKEEK